jgi:hypothetical protein
MTKLMVHSALYVPALDRLVARVPNAATLKQSIMAHQTSAEDAARVHFRGPVIVGRDLLEI